jgi:hypothetical protein
MLAISIFALFAAIAVVSAVTLVDCWLKAQHAYAALSREWAALEQGFVPMVEAQDLRLRQMARRPACGSIARQSALRSAPSLLPVPAHGAA